MQKEDMHGFKCPVGYKFDKKLMVCVPTKSRFKTQYAYPYFGGGDKSGDQSGETQNGQNGNGNGNGANGNGANGNGGNGNGNGGGESFLEADVRKMLDGRFGVYADVFKKGRRVLTPGGKHEKNLKKFTKEKKMQTIIWTRNNDCKRWWVMKTFKQFTEKAPNTADAMKRYKAGKGFLQISHI